MSKKFKPDVNPAAAELPLDVAAIAQKSVSQAQVAFEKAGDFAKDQAATQAAAMTAAAETYKTHLADLQAKTLASTKTNMSAAFAFAHQVFGLKDVSALVSLQQDFFKSQAAAFQVQAKEINDIAVSMTKDGVKPVQDGLAQSVNAFQKAFAA
jgi:hypothetical protein